MSSRRTAVLLSVTLAINASATTRYVDLNNANPVAPYTSWETAATNIQDAVDASVALDLIWVTNGIYATGGRPANFNDETNRVLVDKTLTIQSVNGPQVTLIWGDKKLEGTRCISLASQCVLNGFTLTNGGDPYDIVGGVPHPGGGVLCGSGSVVTNCIVTGCSATGDGAGINGGIIRNCIITNSISGSSGGGVAGSKLIDCTIVNNSARAAGGGVSSCALSNCIVANNSLYTASITNPRGGGASNCTLTNCTVMGNVNTNSGSFGGGASLSTLVDCFLWGNKSRSGGGTDQGTLIRCVVSNNAATLLSGGGSYSGTLTNCTLTSNTALSGGGASSATLNNCTVSNNIGSALEICTATACTVVGNSGLGMYFGSLNNGVIARNQGGASSYTTLRNCLIYENMGSSIISTGSVYNCTIVSNASAISGASITNSIVYYNAGGNYLSGAVDHCCITPLPTNGSGNFTNAPLFVDFAAHDFRLQDSSPCINSGYNPAVTGTKDFAGNPRIVGGTVDIGAYEFQSPTSILSYQWAQKYGFPTDGSADYLDGDADGMNNWQEWRAQTDPTDTSSVLRMLSVTNDALKDIVNWSSATGVRYFIQRSGNLGAQPAFVTIATNLLGAAGTTSYTNVYSFTNAPSAYYRVGVQ